jgi:hypothetical protein
MVLILVHFIFYDVLSNCWLGALPLEQHGPDCGWLGKDDARRKDDLHKAFTRNGPGLIEHNITTHDLV